MRTNQIIKQQKNKFLSFGAVILFNIALAGSLCGTFAWYTYATRTGFKKEYHGTTVGDLGSLQAGIVSDTQLEEYFNYELAEDTETLADENKIIYWCPKDIKATTINYVISANGSATNVMDPVTTGDSIDDFCLYRAPTVENNYSIGSSQSFAPKKSYLHIPFVFRFEDAENLGEYLPNFDIFVTAIDVETTTEGHNIYKAVRTYISNGTTGVLINPTAETDGKTIVGGVLDLDSNGYYDVDDNNYEIIYGQYDETSYPYKSEVEDANGTLPMEDCTSFNANHAKGVYAIDENNFVPKSISYQSMDLFSSKAKPISRTNADYHNLAIVDFYAFFEGWDLNVINEEQGHAFNMDLRFEVIA